MPALRATAVAVIVGLLLASLIAGREIAAAAADPAPGKGLPVFGEGPLPAAERVVSTLDGERYAQLAADPTMARPAEGFRGNIVQAAYIASRPLFSWLAWAASGGGRTWALGWTMVVLSVLSAGLLVLGVALLGRRNGRNPLWAWTAIALPGAVAVVQSPGEGDVLAAALVLFGVLFWVDERHRWLAVVMFVLAALARDSSLLAPGALFGYGVLKGRRPPWPLLLPFGAYAGWVVVVRARVGVWPSSGGGDNLDVPFAGLRGAVPAWGLPEVVSVALLAVLVVASWKRLAAPVRAVVAVYAGSLLLLSDQVLAFWWGFGRILLPAYALCLAAVLPREHERERSPR